MNQKRRKVQKHRNISFYVFFNQRQVLFIEIKNRIKNFSTKHITFQENNAKMQVQYSYTPIIKGSHFGPLTCF